VPFSVAGIPVDAKTAISVVCGAFLLPHTIAKLANVERASQLFDRSASAPPASSSS
jgi:hypothetical protein